MNVNHQQKTPKTGKQEKTIDEKEEEITSVIS